jgi:adenosylmethionine-8-amino-7-oxononanoate aminotransferase
MPITAFTGDGAILRTSKGELIDLSAGAGITCLGYGHRTVTEALKGQLDTLPYAHAANFTTSPVEQLAQMLLDSTAHPSFDDGAVMFLNGGGEAVEAACKLAVQYFTETQAAATSFIARERSYHGNSFFCLALGEHPRKWPYLNYNPFHPNLLLRRLPVHQVGARSSALDLAGLEDQLKDRANVTIVIEPIAGTTCGIEPPQRDYLPRLKHLCTPTTLLIYDEVLCGNYRTGRPYAWQHFAPTDPPDMIVIGKGLTGGYFPLSAVIVNARVKNALLQGSGKLWHSTTNQNHALGSAAGIAASFAYRSAVPRIKELSLQLKGRLRQLKLNHERITRISGEGCLWGIQLDKALIGVHETLRSRGQDFGLALYTDGGPNNEQANMILIAPPYCITDFQMDLAFHRLDRLLKEVLT